MEANYETIKALRAEKTLPTQEQFEEALKAQRAVICDTAIQAATLSGEYHAKYKMLPMTEGEDLGAQYHAASNAHTKAMRHMSKLVYWYAKFQAGLFLEEVGHGPSTSDLGDFAGSDEDDDEGAVADDEGEDND